MTVRRAAAGDEPALARLLGELGYRAGAERLTARIARLPATTTVLVADDGGVVGLAALDVRVYLEHDEPRGRVIACVVALRHAALAAAAARERVGGRAAGGDPPQDAHRCRGVPRRGQAAPELVVEARLDLADGGRRPSAPGRQGER